MKKNLASEDINWSRTKKRRWHRPVSSPLIKRQTRSWNLWIFQKFKTHTKMYSGSPPICSSWLYIQYIQHFYVKCDSKSSYVQKIHLLMDFFHRTNLIILEEIAACKAKIPGHKST